jgi:hypothetical protein
VISNPGEDISAWRSSFFQWPGTDSLVNWFSGVSLEDMEMEPQPNSRNDTVYLLGTNTTLAAAGSAPSTELNVLRIPLPDLEAGRLSAAEYYVVDHAGQAAWRLGVPLPSSGYRLSPLVVPPAGVSGADTTLHFSQYLQQWYLFTTNGTVVTMHVGGSHNPVANSPWGWRWTVYTITDAESQGGVFSIHSPKAHPGLERSFNEIVLSYVLVPKKVSKDIFSDPVAGLLPKFLKLTISREPVPPRPGPPGSLSLVSLFMISIGGLLVGTSIGCWAGCCAFPIRKKNDGMEGMPLLFR